MRLGMEFMQDGALGTPTGKVGKGIAVPQRCGKSLVTIILVL